MAIKNDDITESTKPAKTIKRKPKEQRHNKIDLIRRQLNRVRGATMADLTASTNWQPHSVRAALSRLRRSGISIERRQNKGGQTVYHCRQGDPS